MPSKDGLDQNDFDAATSSTRRFEFIAVSGTETRTNLESLRRARSHPQAEYRRRSRRQQQVTRKRQQTPVPGPLSFLGAGRVDPFQSFHLGDNPRVHRLWDHVYDGSCPKFRALIAIGFIDLVRESIGRAQMLSASAWHLVNWMGTEPDSGDAERYSIISTRSLQASLNSLGAVSCDEVIAAILTSAAYANMIKDPQTFQVHMDGLAQILHLPE
ncbi:hypothetical protein ACHAQJ_002022 [Trichoderma viride]